MCSAFEILTCFYKYSVQAISVVTIYQKITITAEKIRAYQVH